jgi:hypothetical protein
MSAGREREKETAIGAAISLNSSCPGKSAERVFALDIPGIHVLVTARKSWMAGSSLAMTTDGERGAREWKEPQSFKNSPAL